MNQKRHAINRQSGFTLMEIMIVIAIIGVIAGIVASKIFGNKDQAYYKLAQSDMQTLASKIDNYETDVGALPNNLSDLVTQPGGVSGWLGPYSREKDLKDPWGTPYQFRQPGTNSRFEIVSYAADRKVGGDSVNADIRVEN